MDAKQVRLQKKLEDLLNQATAVAVELQAIEQGPGTPHYDQIELPAHALGQQAQAEEAAAAAQAKTHPADGDFQHEELPRLRRADAARGPASAILRGVP